MKSLENLMPEQKRDNDCAFCYNAMQDVGYKSDFGAGIVYQTGKSLLTDWFVTLQPITPSDPSTGFSMQLMPVAHLESFSGIHNNPWLEARLGRAIGSMSYAFHVLRYGESDDKNVFEPCQIFYGKCHTPENTQAHIHFKTVDFSGGVAQAFPTDNGWTKKETFYEIEAPDIVRKNNPMTGCERLNRYIKPSSQYVKANPVVQHKLSDKRLNHVASRLIEIFDEINLRHYNLLEE